MSQAFMREKDEEWLGDVKPDTDSLLRYLTRENNGTKVYLLKSYPQPKTGRMVHEVSTGSAYMLDEDGRWSVI